MKPTNQKIIQLQDKIKSIKNLLYKTEYQLKQEQIAQFKKDIAPIDVGTKVKLKNDGTIVYVCKIGVDFAGFGYFKLCFDTPLGEKKKYKWSEKFFLDDIIIV